MAKKRTFLKKVVIKNFKLVANDSILRSDKLTGKILKEEVELLVRIHFTPKGYCLDLQFDPSLIVWDFDHLCKIKGVSEINPEGDLTDKNFTTELSAMHFISRRLSKFGWKPLEPWESL